MLRSRYRLAILSVLLFVSVLAAAASTKSYWEDESWTGFIIQQDLHGIVTTDLRVHPPLYYLVSAGWSRLAGSSELAVRWLSIACLSLGLCVGLVLMRRWFGPRAAHLFLVLFPTWPLLLVYGHNARYYAWVALLALLALWCVDTALRRQRWIWLAGYVLCGIALLYTAYTTAAVLAGLWVWWLTQPRDRKLSLPWWVANGVITLAFLPMLTVFNSSVRQLVATPSLGGLIRQLAVRAGLLTYGFTVGETISPLNPVAWIKIAVVAAVVIAGVWVARGHARQHSVWRLWLMCLGMAVGILGIAALVGSNDSSPQNVINRSLFVLPFVVMALAACLAMLRPRWQTVLSLLLLAGNTYAGVNYFLNREYLKPILTVPWREIMSEVRASSAPGASVSPSVPLALICNRVDFACIYYGQRYGLNPLQPDDAIKLLAQPPAEPPAQIWWVNSNVTTRASDVDQQAYVVLVQHYGEPTSANFAPQDPSIIAFKKLVTPGDVYAYRVNVWRFSRHE